jgi:hypothetical protein
VAAQSADYPPNYRLHRSSPAAGKESSKASASSSFEQYLDKVRAQPRHEVPTAVRSQGSIMPRIQKICFAAVTRCGTYDKKMAPDPPKGNTPLRWPNMNLHGVEGFQTNLYNR